MRNIKHKRSFWLGGAGIAALLLVPVGRLEAAPDPVEELRLALASPKTDVEQRKKSIQDKIKALATFGDFRRALALTEWKVDISRGMKPPLILQSFLDIEIIDVAARREVGERLRAGIESVIAKGDALSRLGMANFIAEMDPTIRALDRKDSGGYTRSLAPLVVRLARDKDLAVRQEALRALGTIFADPKDVVEELEKALKDSRLGPQRIAADALLQMIKVATYINKQQTPSGVQASTEEVIAIATTVVNACGEGFTNADAQVRMLCLEAMKGAAAALSDEVPSLKSLPPPDREWTEAEKKDLQAKLDRLKKSAPLFRALDAQGKRLLDLLRQADARRDLAAKKPGGDTVLVEENWVKRKAIETLETTGHLRHKLHRLVTYLSPAEELAKLFADYDPLKTLLAQDKDLALITRLVNADDVELRRKALEFLETLPQEAGPALPAVIGRLADPDRFVRWGAARALEYIAIAPDRSPEAVARLGRLLVDADPDVRRAAAETLQFFATTPALRQALPKAVPFLIQAIQFGDTESRVSAMHTALSFGVDIARPVVPYLVNYLKSNDPALDSKLLSTPADVLGKFGPAAFVNPDTGKRNDTLWNDATGALRRLLGHEDREVRRSASDALLNLLQGKVKG